MRISTRAVRALALLSAVLCLCALVERAGAQFAPESWHIHAQAAGGGGAADNPPDFVLGAQYGSHGVNAIANGSGGINGQFGVNGAMQPDHVTFSFGGSMTAAGPNQGGSGSGNGDLVFTLPSTTTINVNNPFQGSIHVDGHASLTGASAGQIFNRTYFNGGSSPTDQLFVLPADTYTFHVDGNVHIVAGSGGGGNIFLDLQLVPEPSVLGILAVATCGGLMRRSRRVSIPKKGDSEKGDITDVPFSGPLFWPAA